MTKPPIESVPTLEGRELDSAVCNHVFGVPADWSVWPTEDYRDYDSGQPVPHYSTDYSHLEAMIEAVRLKGWNVEITENLSPDESDWIVRLTFSHGGHHSQREAGGDTLPLAFARAAMMTTYTTETDHAD